jgi:signal transduction histidine kinase
VKSLRSRIILGSILGGFGLLMVAHLFFVLVLDALPRFRGTHEQIAFFVALTLMVAGLLQVRSGLSPVQHLRQRLGQVRDGADARIQGTYPSEVQPLVDDLNELLDHRERAVGRAVAKAADLAHGLKTPLAILEQEAERAEIAGHHELARRIGQQVDRMRRQVDYHLASARAAASGATPGARCSVIASAEGLARTLLQLHQGRGLTIEVHVGAEHSIRGQSEDLDEMLGNLLDNACKWAKSRVIVASCENGPVLLITVDDDGPGVDPSLRDQVLRRGVRADEAAPGSGLGLAIVRDLAELYGGSISLERSPAGGLRARLELPC